MSESQPFRSAVGPGTPFPEELVRVAVQNDERGPDLRARLTDRPKG